MDFFLNSDFASAIDEFGLVFFGNSLSQWMLSVCLTVMVFLFFFGLKRLFLKKLPNFVKKEESRFGNFFRNMLKACGSWFFLVIAIYFGSKPLQLDNYQRLITDITEVAMFIQIGAWLSIMLSEFLQKWEVKNNQDAASIEIVIFNNFGRFLIWTLVLLLALDNMGVKVVSLMTGLGIGGIAVALAVQKILGDLFASISIMLDKPFEIGDMVVVDEYCGYIEKIGMKTTRMRSVSGEQLILSNSDLLGSRIRNYKRMTERRVTFSFGVTHRTSRENLKAIPEIFKDIIDKQKNARFDRANLQGIGDFSMIYECVYWIESPDMKVFMNVQQNVILDVIDAFAARNISFAHPTQTLFVGGVGNNGNSEKTNEIGKSKNT
ncbi:MAG: mechanosensitive ion channel [Chitinispirillales bacterium]|jgi:small-conductance mechanosensitive channel|nr:mechanosensitive ion channel [Chitinispirillales bacterium]